MLTTDIVKKPARNRSESIPDEELFHRYRQGDERAFVQLFERQKGPLFTYCRRMMGDTHRASDAFQETFVRVVKYRASFRRTESFRAWLFTIARNVCFAAYRAGAAHEELHDEMPEIAAEVNVYAPDVTEREALADALSKLPPAMREALLLYEYEGFSYQEIADMTNSGLSAVKVRIHRARTQLRRMLEPILRAPRR